METRGNGIIAAQSVGIVLRVWRLHSVAKLLIKMVICLVVTIKCKVRWNMCIALDEINSSNVTTLTQVKYKHGNKEYISDVICCDTFEQFYVEYNKQQRIEDIHSWSFLILDFELTETNIAMFIKNGNRIIWRKLIFTQDDLEIYFDSIGSVILDLCCSVSKQFKIGSKRKAFSNNDIPCVSVSVNCCYIVNADFTFLSRFISGHSKLDKLVIVPSKMDHFLFRENIIGFFNFSDMFDQGIKIPIEISNTSFTTFYCYLSSMKEKVRLINCKFLSEVRVEISDEIGRLIFDNCFSTSKTVFDFEKAVVYDRFALNLDKMPARLIPPAMTTSTEKTLALPRSENISVSHFIPLTLSDLNIDKLKREMGENANLISDDNFRSQVEIERRLRILERAYVLVNNADRNIEALAILEEILKEKRKGQLVQREIDAEKRKYFSLAILWKERWADLKHLLFFYLLGAFVNLNRVFCTFLLVVLAFASFFYVVPSLLKMTDEAGNHVLLSDLSIIDRGLNSIYFTVVTLTTLGYGDIQPLGFGKVVAAFLACLGLFLSGIILAVILRRYSR